MFSVGDPVIVSNISYCLSDYKEYFEYNHLNLLLNRYKRWDSLKLGMKAVVIAKFLHHMSKHFIVYCIETENHNIYLMAEDGLSSA